MAGGDVEHAVKHSHVFVEWQRGQVAIQTLEQPPRIQDRFVAPERERLPILADQGGQDRRHEGRGRAVPGYIGDVETDQAFAQQEVVDEVAAQNLRGENTPGQGVRADLRPSRGRSWN